MMKPCCGSMNHGGRVSHPIPSAHLLSRSDISRIIRITFYQIVNTTPDFKQTYYSSLRRDFLPAARNCKLQAMCAIEYAWLSQEEGKPRDDEAVLWFYEWWTCIHPIISTSPFQE